MSAKDLGTIIRPPLLFHRPFAFEPARTRALGNERAARARGAYEKEKTESEEPSEPLKTNISLSTLFRIGVNLGTKYTTNQ